MQGPSRRRKWLALVLVLLGTALIAGACGGVANKVSLTGAGSTFAQPIYLEWIGQYTTTVDKNVSINYQGIGSGGGIQQFSQLTVDFGGTDAPMSDQEIATAEQKSGAKVLHIPTVFGSVTLAYSLPDVQTLKLDPSTLAGIFLGQITKWNDPALVAINSGVTLPDTPIQVVHRSDSSGTTNIFTTYLAKVSSDWAGKVGAGKDVKWPVGIGGQGNDGVAAIIKQQSGSIGYIELTYALESKTPVASMKNKSGNFVVPSLETTSAAAQGITVPADLRFSMVDSSGANAYPIAGATWVLAYDKMKDPAKAKVLSQWLTWDLQNGDSIAQSLGYATLPADLKAMALAKVSQIK